MSRQYRPDGGWFHSRSSSNCSELAQVEKLVVSSRKTKYAGLRWAGDRHNNPLLSSFSDEIGVKPSTMQTKIRAMIRYGFLQDKPNCPLAWTRPGGLWSDLRVAGNNQAARKVYQITLAYALSVFAFDRNGYAKAPENGVFPLQKLLQRIGEDDSISNEDFLRLVEGKSSGVGNASYWRADLKNCGLFEERDGGLVVASRFKRLAEAIRSFPSIGSALVNDQQARINSIWKHPSFREPLHELLRDIDRSEQDDSMLRPLENAFVETFDDEDAVSGDPDLARNPKTRTFTALQRNLAWSKIVKERYRLSCAMPECDVSGVPFVEAAHIKAHSADESGGLHRSHLLNGLCLCKHCHSAFDGGFFSLCDNAMIIVSSQLQRLKDQHPKRVVESSRDKPIRSPASGRGPLPRFVRYHRQNVFKG